MADPKKLAMMIIARKKPGMSEPDGDEPAPDDGPSGGEAAAQDILDAISKGDAGALAEALKSFMDVSQD